jgi:hypothetical protein
MVSALCRYQVQNEATAVKRVKTVKRAPRPKKVEKAQKVIFVFEAAFTMSSGQTFEGWFYCAGPSWKLGEPCTGPFETEKAAADHADEFGGWVQ